MPPVVIFALSHLSALAAFNLKDAGRSVVAFTDFDPFCDRDFFEDRRVIPLSMLAAELPPDDHEVVVAMGSRRMNQLRRETCSRLEVLGYRLGSFISPNARVWSGFQSPQHLMIYEGTIVQPFVEIGNNVTLRANVNLGHHTRVGNDVFLASGVVTGGDVLIGDGSVVGLGAVIRNGIKVAPRTFIGAGAVVVRDTEENGVYVGNPARPTGKSAIEVTGG